MRLVAPSRVWWRIDAVRPRDWEWVGFGHPRHRFDPPSGRFRVRYAANDPVATARERFPARRVPLSSGDLQLVRLEAPDTALHLTHQRNLDALGLDDRINTGRLDQPLPGGNDPLLAVSQQLSDGVYDWWDGSPPPIVYRTRTLPAARNMAFTASCSWGSTAARALRDARSLLVALVTNHGFDVPDTWL